MTIDAPGWMTDPDWWMVLITVAAVVAAFAAALHGRRQSKSAARSADIAAESKQIAAQARDEARRSADAAEKSAESARRVADIEARRDHQAVLNDVELVEVTDQARERLNVTDRVARLRNNGQRTFRYRARVFHTENSSSELRAGVWKPGETLTLFLGSAGQTFSHLEVWLDGECPCQVPDGEDGHWLVTFRIPYSYEVGDSLY